jgi:hypothetical protein
MRDRLYRFSCVLGVAVGLVFSGVGWIIPASAVEAQPVQVSPNDPVAPEVTREWQEFLSDTGGFGILMPGMPSEAVLPAEIDGLGNTHLFQLQIDGGVAVYGIAYTDILEVPNELSTAQIDYLLNYWRDGVVGKQTLVSERTIVLDGYRGREIEFQDSKGIVSKARGYLVEKRLYQLIVISASDFAFSEEDQLFLDSFRLLAPL